ncbi:protein DETOXIFICATION 27-like [Zingiber officinale]|uniref:protein DETOXIFICATION 27-like n=1 Tax=Zingiber officinale TaxID=94328 RepID=UPI001C4DB224|nr:protein DETOXIFICATION 27-like [Zingiber officinale]
METGVKRAPLLDHAVRVPEEKEVVGWVERSWIESKKLWRIVGPAIFGRVVIYSMNVISQAFAGHLGDLELASMSIANAVIVGFSFGLMLGMASALETLCGQAYGAKKYHMLGVYMQRSWIVLFLCAVLLLPIYLFATPLLLLLGQPPDLAKQAGAISIWSIPLHFCFAFYFPIVRFLQSQLKNNVTAVISFVSLLIHLFVTWICVVKLQFGLFGTAMTLNFSWWAGAIMLFIYIVAGGCPDTWNGFSMEAFVGLWDFLKLSSGSGIMMCLEIWYYRILILLTGNLSDAKIAVDALSICMNINGWELMIPLGFFSGTGVRVANELGAGNGKGAKFSTVVSTVTSSVIGLIICALIMWLHDIFALIFTSSPVVIQAADKLSLLLAFTVLLNSVQPVLSGVAVGAGWQGTVAFVNIGSYYLIGIPLGVIMGWAFDLGVQGIWGGMICGTAIQTLILVFLTIRCDWEKEALRASSRMADINE